MRSTLLLCLVLLTGCVTYHAQPVAPEQLAHQFEARTLADGALHTYLDGALGHDIAPWPPVRWNLTWLTLAAWHDSPAVAVAMAQWTTAQAGIRVAGALPNPTLQFPLQWSAPNPGPGSPWTLGPSLDIPIETAGKRGHRVDQATRLAESARLNVVSEAWKVRAQVRGAMLAVYAAHEHGRFLSQKAEALESIVRMVRKRRDVGEGSGPDLDAAVLASTQAQSGLAAAESAESDARAQLAAAIGVPASALAGIALDFDAFDAAPAVPPDADARRAAIFRRADLLASLSDYAATEAALQLEVAKQYPDIHLGPGYTFDTGTHRISFGLAGITLPIFDQNQGGIAEAEAKRKEAAARTAALQDTLLSDLDRNLDRYRASVTALRMADRRLDIVRRQLDGQAAGFASGNTDRLAYTQAQADFTGSRSVQFDALIAVQQAAGQLEDTLQRPLAGDARAMNIFPAAQDARK